MASAKPKKTYNDIQHGIEELWSAESPDVDIVAIPGLGADPRNCWVSDVTSFDWLTDDHGLRSQFHHTNTENGRVSARVLLYLSETAWQGRLRVKADLYDLAYALLEGLRSNREANGAQRRPIVFIGHSMGGLVIAKAICIAHSERLAFPTMFEAITGAVFFGTPFEGTAVAVAAYLFDTIGGNLADSTARSSLLELMKPGSAQLKELKNQLLILAKDPSVGAQMNMFCFFEKHYMDITKVATKMFSLPWFPANSLETRMVQDTSARLDGYHSIGLSKNHSNMVTFAGPKDPEYLLVRGKLAPIVQEAPRVAKSRFHSVRDYNRDEVKQVLKKLRGPFDSDKMLQDLRKEVLLRDPSWILGEEECADWLNVQPNSRPTRCLWIRGTEGRAKSSAVVSVIDKIIKDSGTGGEKGHSQPLCAFFLCGSSHETLTAEELLKSLLFQLIEQQETLYTHAKQFANNKTSTSPTVENLWYSLVSILSDALVDKVFLIVHDMHNLSEKSDGTKKLLKRLQDEISPPDNAEIEQRRSKVRWLFTSRDSYILQETLRGSQTREMNLNDTKYGSQVGKQLRQHADQKVTILSDQKNYNKAFAYFASSLIETRAQDTVWIDITCLRLAQIPPNTKATMIRRELERIPEDLNKLLDSIWSRILDPSDDDTDDVKEMLRVLVLAKEPVTLEELAVLTDFTMDEVKNLLHKCDLLLKIDEDGKVIFVLENQVKEHLMDRRIGLLQFGDHELKWQHGILAWRCYIYLVETFKSQNEETDATQENTPQITTGDTSSGKHGRAAMPEEHKDTHEGGTLTPEHSDSDKIDGGDGTHNGQDSLSTEAPPPKETNRYNLDLSKLLEYPIKHWLFHASRATRGFAERISGEDDFWARDSITRKKWLWAYVAFGKDPNLSLLTSENFTGLHAAASLGYAELVASLMDKGHTKEKDIRDAMFNTPLHLAAFWGHTKIVEELLNRGAFVDDGIEEHNDTALAMAAGTGQVETMEHLLARDANVNAVFNNWGPLINCAIASGNRKAVQLLVDKNASLSVSTMSEEAQQSLAPLSFAAVCSDLGMLNFLLERYHEDLSTQDYEQAFSTASLAGKTDIMEMLVMAPKFNAEDHDFEPDLDVAVEYKAWKSVKFLVGHEKSRGKTNFDEALVALVKDVDENLDILEAFWDNVGDNLSKEKVDEALYIATDKEKEDAVRLLLTKFKADANATGEEFGDALTAAAHDGTKAIIDMLIEHKAEIDAPTGWALQIAAGRGHIDVVRRLLDEHADVNRVIDKPQFPPCTALQAACEGGYDEIVELLLSRGAKPNAGGGQIRYPIIAAACFAHGDILTKLVEAGADVNVTAGEAYCHATPLILASASLPVASVIELIAAGADVNYADDEGDTALITATLVGDSNLVRELLKRKANVMHVNKSGLSALQVASVRKFDECIKILGDWISLLLLGIQRAVDAESEAPIQEVLNSIDYSSLREEVVVQQKAAYEALEAITADDNADGDKSSSSKKYITTDFFGERSVTQDVGSSGNDIHDENTDRDSSIRDRSNGADGQDNAGDDRAHNRGNDRSLGARNRANAGAGGMRIDHDGAEDRRGDNDPDVEDQDNDEDGRDEDGMAGNGQNGEEDEYAIVRGTAHMRLSDEEGSQSMERGYGEDGSGNGSDAVDGDDDGEEDNMMDDDEYQY